MAEKNTTNGQGYGKYLLTEQIRSKYASVISEDSGAAPVSSILYLEGIHFNLVYFPLKHLGYKSVVNSVADLYCRNMEPVKLAVNLGISGRFKKDDIESIIEGMSLACEKYGLKISSLDISSSLTGLAISIASYGRESENLSMSEPATTDLVCVSGNLGAAFMGLQLLERERRVFEDTGGAQPRLEGFEYVIGRQLKPELKIKSLYQLKKDDIHPGIIRTLRDGLASELIHISRETATGCRVYHDKLPIDPDTAAAGKELGFEPLIAALNGGDDFEFVFTVPVSEHEKLDKQEDISIIGHLVPEDEGNSLVLQDGSLAELKAQGWEDSPDTQ